MSGFSFTHKKHLPIKYIKLLLLKKKEKERTEEGINELDRNCSIRTTGKK